MCHCCVLLKGAVWRTSCTYTMLYVLLGRVYLFFISAIWLQLVYWSQQLKPPTLAVGETASCNKYCLYHGIGLCQLSGLLDPKSSW